MTTADINIPLMPLLIESFQIPALDYVQRTLDVALTTQEKKIVRLTCESIAADLVARLAPRSRNGSS